MTNAEHTKPVKVEIKEEKVTEVIKEEIVKEENDKEEKTKEEETVRVVPVRPIILPAHLMKSQQDMKDDSKGLHSLHLGKRARSFFSDISNHISTNDMSIDIHEASAAEREEEKRALKVATQNWDDLDAEDRDDPMMVTEYVNDIFEYMRILEVMKRRN